MYHYVYRITNKILNKHYYGKRSSKKLPKEDLGIFYFSSCKKLKNDIKLIGAENFKFKVIILFNSAKDAINFETLIHKKFDVKNNDNFYNQANQLIDSFDTTGKAYYFNTLENKYEFISLSDKKDHHIGCMSGYQCYFNIETNQYEMINKSDNRIGTIYFHPNFDKRMITNNITNESKFIKLSDYENNYDKNIWKLCGKSINKNKTVYKNIETELYESIDKNDERIGTLYIHNSNNMGVFFDTIEKINVKIENNHPEIGSRYIGVTKGYSPYLNNETNEYEMVKSNDERIGKTLFKHSYKKAPYINKSTNEKAWLSTNDPRIGIDFISIHSGTTTYKNIYTDEYVRLDKNDERINISFVGCSAKKKKYISEDNEIIEVYKCDPILKTKKFKEIKNVK